jgi:hypothetical protein
MERLGMFIFGLLPLLVFSACAIPVHQIKLTHPLTVSTEGHFVIQRNAKCSIGTGYSRELHAGSHWNQVGTVQQGSVYRSPDQALTVEGFNVHEAYIVIKGVTLVGFYLPVEKTFTPVSKSVDLSITETEEARR